MKFDIKVEGLQMIIKNLDGLDKDVIKDVQKATRDGADIVTQKTKANIRSKFKKKTGNLENSPVTKEMPVKEGWALVSISAIDRSIAPHAHLHEFGTSKITARPFQRPAFDISKGEIKEKINSALSGAVRRHN